MITAFYAGSFNPFTVGHKSIVDRGLSIFDKIIIGVGYNINKPGSVENAKAAAEKISEIFAKQERVRVVVYKTLTTEAARENGAQVLLRGVRDNSDFEAERNMADINRKISGMETVILTAVPEYSFVSSSMVRELAAFGVDVSQFLPETDKVTNSLSD